MSSSITAVKAPYILGMSSFTAKTISTAWLEGKSNNVKLDKNGDKFM